MTAAAASGLRLYVGELRQLFDSLDPAPFRERDLDPKAAEYAKRTVHLDKGKIVDEPEHAHGHAHDHGDRRK
jgi:hypothetical protein